MAYEVEVFQRDGAGCLPPPEITIKEIPDDTPYSSSPRGFSTSNGGYHQINTFHFNSLWEAQEFARNYGR